MSDTKRPLLEIKNLSTFFHTNDGVVRAVDGVSLSVDRGEILGLVGESGCGKSVTSFSVMQLVGPPGRIESGEVLFDGKDLLEMSKNELVDLRGDHISMIFQQPTMSLNPVTRVGVQISEVFEIHRDLKRSAGLKRAVEMLKRVGIPDPEGRVHAFPHEFSGRISARAGTHAGWLRISRSCFRYRIGRTT